MSQADAIDLTLVISDSEDEDAPICLSSRDSTPRPAPSPEPEIEVIESPVANVGVGGGRGGGEGRTRRRAERSEEPDATAILLQVLDKYGNNDEDAEASGTAASPISSPPKSTRPKPRRRVRLPTPDEAGSSISTSQQPLSSPRVPAVSASQSSRKLPPLSESTTAGDDAESVPGTRVWKKKVRALNFSSTEELLNSVASTSTPRRTASADRVVVPHGTPAAGKGSEAAKGSESITPRTEETHPTEDLPVPVPSKSTTRRSHKKKDRAADRAAIEPEGTSAPNESTQSGGSYQQPNEDGDSSVEPIRESETLSAIHRPRVTSSASQRTSSKAYRSLMDRFRGGDAGGSQRRERALSAGTSSQTLGKDNANASEKASPADNTVLEATLSSLDMMDVDEPVEGNATLGPAQVTKRTKRNRHRTAESKSTPQSFDMDIDSPSSFANSPVTLPRSLSIFSVSSQSSALAEETVKTMGSSGIVDAEDWAGEQEIVVPEGDHGNVNGNPEPATASSDGFTILPIATTPHVTGRNRQRSSPPVDTATTSDSTPKKGNELNSPAKTDETISPIRRSARERKASEAMKTYVEQSGGPRFSKRLCQKTIPEAAAARLPTPPPLASSREVTPAVQDSPRFSKRLSQKATQASVPLRLPTPPSLNPCDDSSTSVQFSSVSRMQVETPNLNARTGFSLPTVPWHPPMPWPSPAATQGTPSAPSISSPRTLRKRPAVEYNTMATKAPAAASPSAPPASRIAEPSADEESPAEEIPFPPCDEGENEFLKSSDFADARLMAAFAALDTSGNKAMSAEEIAAVCMERGWLPKSLGVNAPACISNALRSYQRRIESAANGPRRTLLARHMFFGGWAEAYLLPGLHPDNLKKLTESGIGRPRGSFWYLEGWYGSVRWKSPFEGLRSAESALDPKADIPAVPMEAPQPVLQQSVEKRTETSTTANKKAVGKPVKTPQATSKKPVGRSHKAQPKSDAAVSSPPRPPRMAPAASGLRLRLKVASNESPSQQVAPKVVNAARGVRPDRRRFPTARRPHTPSAGQSPSDSDDHDVSDSSEASPVNFARRFDFYWDVSTDTDSASESGESSVSTESSSLHTQSDRQSVEVLPAGGVGKPNESNRPTINLSMSAGTGPAVFPANPLGPIRWEGATTFSFGSYTFDDTSSDDLSAGMGETDIAMREAYEQAVGNTKSRTFPAWLSPSPRVPCLTDPSLFREPPELDDDAETPASSPGSFADLSDNDTHPAAHDIPMPMIECDEYAESNDPPLVQAVRELGGLLPFNSGLPAAATQGSISKTRRFRPMRNRGQDVSKISLTSISTIPTSLASSPSDASFFRAAGQMRSTWESEPSSRAKSLDSGDVHDDPDMIPGLEEQLSQIGIECRDMCDSDEIASTDDIFDEIKITYCLFEHGTSVTEPLLLLSPGSGDLDDLDGLWDTNTSTAGSPQDEPQQLASFSTVSSSAKQRPSMATPTKLKHNKPTASQDLPLDRLPEQSTPVVHDCMQIPEKDQIGIREVDDAILLAWAEDDLLATERDGDCSMESEYDMDSAMIIDDRFQDTDATYETDSEEAMQVAVDPQILGIGKPPHLQIPDKLPSVPPVGRRATTPLTAAWMQGNHPPQGSKAIPAGALRPRAMIDSASAGKQRHTVSEPVQGSAEATSSPTNAVQSPERPERRRRDRPPRTLAEKVTTITEDQIPVFALLWHGRTLMRRIDSDYINVTSLCIALKKPELISGFASLPGTVEVKGNDRRDVNGFWVHLSLVLTKAETLGMPEDLAGVILDPDLVKRFPVLVDTLAALREATVKGLPKFGAPFGFNFKSLRASASGSPATPTAAQGPSRLPAQTPASSAKPATPGSLRSVAEQPASSTSVKRPSPQTSPSATQTAEPPRKRQKSTDALTVIRMAPSSSNRRPIIPVGVTTTQGATVLRSTARV